MPLLPNSKVQASSNLLWLYCIAQYVTTGQKTKYRFALDMAHLLTFIQVISVSPVFLIFYEANMLIYQKFPMSCVVGKPVFGVSNQVRHKPSFRATEEESYRLEISNLET